MVPQGAREELMQPDVWNLEQKPSAESAGGLPAMVLQLHHDRRGFEGKRVPSKCPNEQQGQEAAPIPGWVFLNPLY